MSIPVNQNFVLLLLHDENEYMAYSGQTDSYYSKKYSALYRSLRNLSNDVNVHVINISSDQVANKLKYYKYLDNDFIIITSKKFLDKADSSIIDTLFGYDYVNRLYCIDPILLLTQRNLYTEKYSFTMTEYMYGTKITSMEMYKVHRETQKSKIITIIGSNKFEDGKIQLLKQLSMMGYVVYCPGNVINAPQLYDKENKLSPGEITNNMIRNFRTMIKLSDYVIVYNKDGYIGDSTKDEIEFALSHDIPVYAIHDQYGYAYEIIICNAGAAQYKFYKLS